MSKKKRCQQRKASTQYWDMRREFVHTTTEVCTYPAKYRLVITAQNKKSKTVFVCGVHKNSIVSHGKEVGYEVAVYPIVEV